MLFRSDREGPRFDEAIPAGGYTWWYVDAISDDGQHGLTIIAFLGSVFSPYYKRSGRSDPLDHACLNVALYGPQHRWVMTERGRQAVQRDASTLAIGPSNVRWEGGALTIDIVEGDTRLFVPWQRPVRGTVHFHKTDVLPSGLNLFVPRGAVAAAGEVVAARFGAVFVGRIVKQPGVIIEHAAGVILWRQRLDGLLHAADPFDRHFVGTGSVIERHDLVFQ